MNYNLIGRDFIIGDNQPCFIIAEAGINHNGDVKMALKLVDYAKESGADAVKFQMRHLPSLYPKSLLIDPNLAEWSFHYILPALKDSELSEHQFREIKQYCHEKNIRFMCTPWDKHSLDFLETLEIELYKISSADFVNLPLIEAVIETRKPMILSTGMSTLSEIERTVEYLKDKKAEFALLHCVSAYPAPFESLNLRFIEQLKRFNVPVGYSSHERGISIPVVARTLGACIIEKHLTLDRTLPGPDHAASLELYGFKKMVRDIRNVDLAMGTGNKQLCQIELLNRQVLRKSLIAKHDLELGTVIGQGDIEVSGPGKGISPQRINDLIGVRIHRKILQGDYFCEGDLKVMAMSILRRHLLVRPWGIKARFHDLDEMLALNSPLIELHLSEVDFNQTFRIPKKPYSQRLIVHCPEFFDRKLLDLCSSDKDHRSRSIDVIQKSIEMARSLACYFSGVPCVVMHSGGMTMDENNRDKEEMMNLAINCISSLDTKDVALLPENLPPRPWYLGGQWNQHLFSSWQDMTTLCIACNLKMTLDVSHAQLYCSFANEPLDIYVKQCLPYTSHVHLADANGIDGEGLQIGEGVIEWEKLLEQLRNSEFSWLPEIWSGHLTHGSGFIEAINRITAIGGL